MVWDIIFKVLAILPAIWRQTHHFQTHTHIMWYVYVVDVLYLLGWCLKLTQLFLRGDLQFWMGYPRLVGLLKSRCMFQLLNPRWWVQGKNLSWLTLDTNAWPIHWYNRGWLLKASGNTKFASGHVWSLRKWAFSSPQSRFPSSSTWYWNSNYPNNTDQNHDHSS